jgi:hypothetical protein
MKVAWAFIFAIAALWIIDAKFNEERYTIAIVRTVRPILSQIGIQI